MKIVVAGASGFLGGRLLAKLRSADHEIIRLVRGATGTRPTPEHPPGQTVGPAPDARQSARETEVRWDPDHDELDVEKLRGADAVINLCGVGVGDRRWTSQYKDLIRSSRVRSTGLLAKACVQVDVPILINASGIGYYGSRGNEPIDESAHAGTSFLAGVCVAWEEATAPADRAGVRVVHLRTGLVLGHEGGLLPRLVLLTKLFAGGKLSSGRQYFPWISATDEIDGIVHLLTADVAGPVNMSGPAPVTNAEFTKDLGRALHRPTPWTVPKVALQLVLGGFAEEVVSGQNALPTALLESGFIFSHATLPEALRSEI